MGPRVASEKGRPLERRIHYLTSMETPMKIHHKLARRRCAACRHRRRHCAIPADKSANTPGGWGKSAEHIGFRRVWRGGRRALRDDATKSNGRGRLRPRFSHVFLWGLIAKVFLCLIRRSFRTGDACVGLRPLPNDRRGRRARHASPRGRKRKGNPGQHGPGHRSDEHR